MAYLQTSWCVPADCVGNNRKTYFTIAKCKTMLNVVSYRMVSYRIASYRIVLYRTVPYRIVSYRIVSYRTVSYRIVSYRTVPYRIVSYRIVSYRIVSYRIVSYRIVSYRIVPYRTVSYRICIEARLPIGQVIFLIIKKSDTCHFIGLHLFANEKRYFTSLNFALLH